MEGAVIGVPVGIVLALVLFLLVYLCRYRICGPNEVMVISGRGKLGFRIVKGGGTFIWPTIERVDKLSLDDMTLEVSILFQTLLGKARNRDAIICGCHPGNLGIEYAQEVHHGICSQASRRETPYST